ncbi:MAG: M48 family metalloprotease [Sphingomonadaceae bacterium]|nr:M48 family metalloprotease [Sphingomonadaceae bacterium]
MSTRLALAVILAALTQPAAAQVSQGDRVRYAQPAQQAFDQFGGRYDGPGVALVERVARQMAVATGVSRDGSDCTVTVLNTDIVNAFALPGCYIGVTRGLMALSNNEAELAFVLGHELGHVKARHSQKRQGRATLASILGAAAGVLTGSDLVAQGAGALGTVAVLGYSRGQEYEADEIGVSALIRAGYDPHAGAEALNNLVGEEALRARLSGRDAAAASPAFLRTHPATGDRVRRAAELADREPQGTGGRLEARSYLSAIDGLLYGDDPAQGLVRGTEFVHPGLRIAFRAPPGWTLANGRSAVTAKGPAGEQAQFGEGALQRGEGLDGYALRLARAVLGNTPAEGGPAIRTTIGGVRAAVLPLSARTGRGRADLLVAVYEGRDAGRVFSQVALGPAGSADTTLRRLIDSFRLLSPADASAVRPRIIDIVEAKPGDSVDSIGRQMAYDDLPVERFRALNDLPANARLEPGAPVKIVRFAR